MSWLTDSCVPDSSSSREAELSRQLQERDERLAALEKENALLREKIDLLVRKLFGAKSEKLDPAQLLLLLQGLDEDERGKAPEPVVPEAARRSTGPSPPRERGPRLPEHLPVIESRPSTSPRYSPPPPRSLSLSR